MTRVTAAEGTVATHTSQIAGLLSADTAIQSAATALTATVAGHTTALSTHPSQIGNLQAADMTISNAATALSLRVTAAEDLTDTTTLSTRVATHVSQLSLLNLIGSFQSTIESAHWTSAVRKTWQSNPTHSGITVSRSGTYLVIGQLRLGGLDPSGDGWWDARLLLSRSGSSDVALNTVLGSVMNSNAAGTPADTSNSVHWVGSLNAGDFVVLQHMVWGTAAPEFHVFSNPDGGQRLSVMMLKAA